MKRKYREEFEQALVESKVYFSARDEVLGTYDRYVRYLKEYAQHETLEDMWQLPVGKIVFEAIEKYLPKGYMKPLPEFWVLPMLPKDRDFEAPICLLAVQVSDGSLSEIHLSSPVAKSMWAVEDGYHREYDDAPSGWKFDALPSGVPAEIPVQPLFHQESGWEYGIHNDILWVITQQRQLVQKASNDIISTPVNIQFYSLETGDLLDQLYDGKIVRRGGSADKKINAFDDTRFFAPYRDYRVQCLDDAETVNDGSLFLQAKDFYGFFDEKTQKILCIDAWPDDFILRENGLTLFDKACGRPVQIFMRCENVLEEVAY